LKAEDFEFGDARDFPLLLTHTELLWLFV